LLRTLSRSGFGGIPAIQRRDHEVGDLEPAAAGRLGCELECGDAPPQDLRPDVPRAVQAQHVPGDGELAIESLVATLNEDPALRSAATEREAEALDDDPQAEHARVD
jgi:hypothetical protein